MSQKTFTSSIFVKLGNQSSQNEEQQINVVQLDLDPVTKVITKERKISQETKNESPPEFVIKPRRQFVNEGQSAKFKASYEGSPSVLTWSKDGTVLHSSQKNKIYTDSREIHVLEIREVSPNDGGIYTCTVRNSAGSAKTTAELEVYSKPETATGKSKKMYVAPSVDSPLCDTKVSPGDKNVTLQCKFSSAIDAITCWYKDGQPLKRALFNTQKFDGRLCKLVLGPISEAHHGVYECSASNTGGEVRTCCRITVSAPGTRSIPPKFINPLSDQILNVGERLVLESKVTGYPQPTIKWYKNQEEIKSSRALTIEFDGSTVRLIMDSVDLSDSDSYKCIAENDVGIDQIKAKIIVQRETIRKTEKGTNVVQPSYERPAEISNQIPVLKSPVDQSASPKPSHDHTHHASYRPELPERETSREPPTFVKELHDLEIVEGDPVELLVEVKGTPPVELVWVHNNSEVSVDHPSYRVTSSGNIQQLVIPKCRLEDAGEFVCEAYNEYGEIDTFCSLIVKENTNFKNQKMSVGRKPVLMVTSDNTNLPPSFILKPHSAWVEKGNSGIFLCRPQGNPKPSVQWLKQDSVIENSEKYQIMNGEDSILEIRNVTEEDCGKYTCLLVSETGSVSTEIELSMGRQPSDFQDSPQKKRSVPDSPKRGGINKKIELFEKSEESSPKGEISSPSTKRGITPSTKLRTSFGSYSEGRNINRKPHHSMSPKSDTKTEDFRDVLNKIKPPKEQETDRLSMLRNAKSSSLSEHIRTDGRRQRDVSPVKVSDAVKKFSQSEKGSVSHHKYSPSGRSFGSPKSIQGQRSRSNVRRIANELSSSPVKVEKVEIVNSPKTFIEKDTEPIIKNFEKVEKLNSPKTFIEKDTEPSIKTRFVDEKLDTDLNIAIVRKTSKGRSRPDKTEIESSLNKTENESKPKHLSVKERQAVLHGDLKTIIDKKQSLIYQEQRNETFSAKPLPETMPVRNVNIAAINRTENESRKLPSAKLDLVNKEMESESLKNGRNSSVTENKPRRNFLAEVSQNDSIEMQAVFGQKFEPAKVKVTPEKVNLTAEIESRTFHRIEITPEKQNSPSLVEEPMLEKSVKQKIEFTPEKQKGDEGTKLKTNSAQGKLKRVSVFDRSPAETNEFQKLLEKKRNSLPGQSPPVIKLQTSNSFRERSGRERKTPSPIIKQTAKKLNTVDKGLDKLQNKPPLPDTNGQTNNHDLGQRSSERSNRSHDIAGSRRLNRDCSPNFRNVLNQIEAKSKNDHNEDKVTPSKPNRERSSRSNILRDRESSPVRGNISKFENSLKNSRISPKPISEKPIIHKKPQSKQNGMSNHLNDSEVSDSSESFNTQVTEMKIEPQRKERMSKLDALSKLYADDQMEDNLFNGFQNKTGSHVDHHDLREIDRGEEMVIEEPRRSISGPDVISRLKGESHRGESSSGRSYANVNGSGDHLDSDNSGEVNMSPGHMAMMSLKRHKLSEVEELFEDFSRIDRELESLKRNPKYGPLENEKYGPLEVEKLPVDEEDKKILSTISGLGTDYTDESNSNPDDLKNRLSKKNRFSKKFDFEKSPASVEQLDFRHVLKRHVEPSLRQHPKILVDLQDVKVKEGEPVTLECQICGIPKPDVAWAMNNKRIKPSKFFRMSYQDNTATLVIAGAYPEDDGEYVCSATNSLGTARCSCHLYVEELNNASNEVTDEEGPYGVLPNRNSSLKSQFEIPTNQNSSLLNNSDLSANQNSSITSQLDISPNQNSSFSSQHDGHVRKISFSSTDTAPSTLSTCEPQSINDSKAADVQHQNMPSVSTSFEESNYDEFEDSFDMVKKHAPRIHEINPRNPVLECGQKLQLQVSFTAEPKPVVRWFRDSFEIIQNEFYHIRSTEHFSRLVIDQIEGGDAGSYHVIVENEMGSDSIDTKVSVLDVPSPPSKPYATETTLFTVILSWSEPESNGGSPVKTYKVEMCNAEEESWEVLSENCSSTSFCATNLAAHNPFFFRVSAKNRIGLSQPSPVSDVIVTKDSNPTHRLSVDSDDVFATTTLEIESPISPFLPQAMQEEELPFSPRTVVPAVETMFEDHYEKIAEVGKGKFGNVYKCLHKDNKSTWAAKVIKCRKQDEKHNVKNEISIMNELTHPKLLMLRDAYETPKSMVLVMEYVGGGELFDRVADEDLELTERDCVHFMRQICEGVRYMHDKSIMHLDLKPENILCVRKDSNLIKIIDFGLARRYKSGESLKVMFGTPEFIAPEVVNYEQIGLPTDIWSLGVICYVLLSGLSPFMGDSDGETLSNVTQGDFDFDDEAFDEISHEAKDFIEKCLHKNMRKRMNIDDCIQHKWLAHTERNSSKKLRQSLRNLKQFMARRKWQKMGHAIRAIGRMANWQKQSKSHDTSINSDSDINSQSDLSVTPLSRSTSKGDNQDISDTTETDEEVFQEPEPSHVTHKESHVTHKESHVTYKESHVTYKESHVTCKDDQLTCENCENNNKHHKSVKQVSESSSPAEITKDMVDCEAVKGDIVRFDVTVEGCPAPHVKWYHGQKFLHEDARHTLNENKNGQYSLVIRDICKSDEGEYSCKVSNDAGEDSCSAELFVYGVNAF